LRAALVGIDELTVLPDADANAVHGNYCLSVVLDEATSARRPAIMNGLKERGVGTSVHYPVALPLSKYYREKYGAEARAFPNATRLANQSIALPVGPHLDPDDMATIARELKAAIAKSKS
jgi:dTDP-4-amino-4,6-dideoxygalactose transaminase